MNGKMNGKGGNIDTRRNPFLKRQKDVSFLPSYADDTFTGMCIDRVIQAGAALILGRTTDGGALVITVLDGEERHRTYCSTQAELGEAIQALLEMYSPK